MSKLKQLWDNYPTVAFLLPIACFMLIGSLEPKPDADHWAGLSYSHYPIVYLTKILLTAVAVALVWTKIRELPWKLSWLGLAVGIIGGGLWIGVCNLGLTKVIVSTLKLQAILGSGERSAFNPLSEMADSPAPALAYAFLAVRFVGLVAVIAVAEELFLRGWLIRYFGKAEQWWKVEFGKTDTVGIALTIVVPMLLHPGELVAAALWFGMVTWLMLRTKSFGDCVVAHATTNLILGIYVVATGHWELM